MKGIVCSYSLERGVFNGPENFPKGHFGKVDSGSAIGIMLTKYSLGVPLQLHASGVDYGWPIDLQD